MEFEYKVYIRNIPASLLDEVYLFYHNQNELHYFHIEKGELLATKFNKGDLGKPLFTAKTQDVRCIVQAFIQVARDIGIKPHHEGKTEGQLEATIKHLEDMRTLVFKK